jgi:hypothetical protein
MRLLQPKNLFLSSIAAFILVSCGPISGYKLVSTSVVNESQVQPVVNKNTPLLYKANIDVFSKHYSGLVLLKQTGLGVSHLVFVTEIGMKMFDYEVTDTSFKPVYVFEPLNKPKITKLLESDMKLILLNQLSNKEAKKYEGKKDNIYLVKNKLRYYYTVNSSSRRVEKIKVKGLFFTKEKVSYVNNDTLGAKQISLKHKGLVRLKINLNYLNKRTE